MRKLYSMIAQCKRQLGSFDEALATCAQGRALYPNDAELLFVQSMLLREKGDNRAAEERLKELIDGRDDDHFASIAVGLRGYKARRSKLNLGMGLGHAQTDHPKFPGTINNVYGEEAARGFYRRWAEMISTEVSA